MNQLRRVSGPTPYAVATPLIGLDVLITSRHSSSLNSWVNFLHEAVMLISTFVTPNFKLDALEEGLLGFQDRYNRTAIPFNWRFGRKSLHELLSAHRSSTTGPPTNFKT